MIMRDVNNRWLIKYTHGMPYDDLIEQTNLTSVVGPRCSFNGSALYGKDNKLDTSNWLQYPLAVLSQICWLPSILLFLVHRIRKVLFKVDSIHI